MIQPDTHDYDHLVLSLQNYRNNHTQSDKYFWWYRQFQIYRNTKTDFMKMGLNLELIFQTLLESKSF